MIDELRKVVWPTSNELWTYFLVVVVFIAAIMAFTGVLDFAFDRLVMWAFSRPGGRRAADSDSDSLTIPDNSDNSPTLEPLSP